MEIIQDQSKTNSWADNIQEIIDAFTLTCFLFTQKNSKVFWVQQQTAKSSWNCHRFLLSRQKGRETAHLLKSGCPDRGCRTVGCWLMVGRLVCCCCCCCCCCFCDWWFGHWWLVLMLLLVDCCCRPCEFLKTILNHKPLLKQWPTNWMITNISHDHVHPFCAIQVTLSDVFFETHQPTPQTNLNQPTTWSLTPSQLLKLRPLLFLKVI